MKKISLRLLRGSFFYALVFFTSQSQAELNCNVGIEFHSGGSIKQCVLNGFHTFHTHKGIRLRCADAKILEQYEKGALKSCTTADDLEVPNLICKAGSRVLFSESGDVTACEAP